MIGYIALAAVCVVVFLFVLQPLLSPRRAATAPVPARVADLLARRQYLMVAIQDVDFDFSSGKIGVEEYGETRSRFLREAAQVLRDLERESGEVDEEIELEILQLRARARVNQQAADSAPTAP
jgi:hypothetical protein